MTKGSFVCFLSQSPLPKSLIAWKSGALVPEHEAKINSLFPGAEFCKKDIALALWEACSTRSKLLYYKHENGFKLP